MRSVRFFLGGVPTTLGDVCWISNSDLEISGAVKPYVTRSQRSFVSEGAHISDYVCDSLNARFDFEGWEDPIVVIKPYENDFNPPTIFPTPTHPNQIIRNANRRLTADITRLRKNGISINDDQFTEDMLTRERPETAEQAITSLQDAIDRKDRDHIAVDVTLRQDVITEANKSQSRVLGAVYKFTMDEGCFTVLKDYMITNNGQYSPKEADNIANVRLHRDITRLREAGFGVEDIQFEIKPRG